MTPPCVFPISPMCASRYALPLPPPSGLRLDCSSFCHRPPAGHEGERDADQRRRDDEDIRLILSIRLVSA